MAAMCESPRILLALLTPGFYRQIQSLSSQNGCRPLLSSSLMVNALTGDVGKRVQIPPLAEGI